MLFLVLVAPLVAANPAANPVVGAARVLTLDPATGHVILQLDEHDEMRKRTNRLILEFAGGVASEPQGLCGFADDAPAAEAAACRAKVPNLKYTPPVAALDLTLTGTQTKPPAAVKGRVDALEVTLTAEWQRGDRGWPDGDGAPPAAASGGQSVAVEVRTAGARQARVVVPWLDSEGMSWDEVSGALACRPEAPRAGRCVLIVVATGNDRNNDSHEVRPIVSAPFDLAAPGLDVKDACAGKLAVSVVADAELVSTSGELVAASLSAAGCKVRAVEPSKAKRGKNVVYAAPPRAAVAGTIAAALGATVEPLTWKTTADVVVAIGR